MSLRRLLLFVLLFGFGTSAARSQSPNPIKKALLTMVREPKLAAVDLVTFRHPAYSLSVLVDFVGIGLDMAATNDRVSQCPLCSESGTWRWFIGARPAPHKVYLMAVGEALFTMTASHYSMRTYHGLPLRMATLGLPVVQGALHARYAFENWKLIGNCRSASLSCR